MSVSTSAISTDELAIKTEGLGRKFGSRWVIENLTMNIPKGCVYGFLGLNGAGKSTTIRMMMGLLTPHAGSISILGLNPAKDDLEIKRRIGYVPDKLTFYEWMTVQEILAFVAYYRGKTWSWNRAFELMKTFDLPLKQKIKTLSKGQRAKVNLLCAMAFDPEILLLDEPTGGLDPVVRREFLEGLLAEYMERGRTVVISSHLINEIAGLVDYVGIVRDGKLIRELGTEELLAGVVRLHVFFETDAPTSVPFTHVLRTQAKGNELILTVERGHLEQIEEHYKTEGIRLLERETLNLEEAFIDYSSGKGRSVS